MYDDSYRNKLKAREETLWAQYALSGVLPDVPCLSSSDDIRHAHAILSGQYNRLQQLLYGEALARMNGLNSEEQDTHVESARWVWMTANSAKRGYVNRVAMNNSLLEFRIKSRNGKMALIAGLEKGAQMLKTTAENKKLALADKLFVRLCSVASERPGISYDKEFVRLLISVGWEFSRHNQSSKLREAVALLPEEYSVFDNYLCENIRKLKDRLRFVDEEPIRMWFNEVRAVEENSAGSDGQIAELLSRAVSFTANGLHKGMGTASVGDDAFDTRKMVLLKVIRLVTRFKNGIPPICAESFLQILRNDGLKGFPDSYYERRKKEFKPGQELLPHAKTEWPSLAEDIAKMIVKAGKTCFGHKRGEVREDVPDLEWAISFLEDVYLRYADDEWADYRIGKLLIWSGDYERGKNRVLPVVRKKQTEYWAWDLLGDLMPEKRKCCVAKALACGADDIYTKAIKKEATALGIDNLPRPELAALLSEAEGLLLEGLEPHRGILIEKFETKEGKKRFVFSVGDGTDIMSVSSKMAKLANVHVGMPVTLYWESVATGGASFCNQQQKVKSAPVNLIAVIPRIDGMDWDVIVPENAVFLGLLNEKSGSTAGIYAGKDGMEFLCRIKAGPFSPGDAVLAYFKDVNKDGRNRECVNIKAVESAIGGKFAQLPLADIVYYGVSQKGTSYMFSSGVAEFNIPVGKFAATKDINLGDAFRIWYSKRKYEDKQLHKVKVLNNVHCIEKIDSAPNVIRQFCGRMRMPKGIDGPGFVGDVFIPTNLFKPLLQKGSGNIEFFVEGAAVTLPPRTKVDRYGIKHLESKARAIFIRELENPELIEYIRNCEEEAKIEKEARKEEWANNRGCHSECVW